MEQVAKRLGVYSRLEKVGLESPNDVLMKTVGDLQKLLNTGEPEILELFQAAAAEVYPWKKRRESVVLSPAITSNNRVIETLTTGDQVIDRILGSGLPLGSVTEVVGESSSGKTQLCLQLCLSAQKPDAAIHGASVYLHSEGQFPAVRLNQMAQAYGQQYSLNPNIMKRSIHTMNLPDRETQYRVLSYQLPVLLSRNKDIKLVVIDSISAPYRGDNNSGGERFERMNEICEVGSRLKRIAHEYKIAVVVVNQVSDTFTAATNSNNDSNNSSNHNDPQEELLALWMDFNLKGFKKSPINMFWSSLTKKPVLGKSWATSVTTRIRMARSIMTDVAPTRRALFVEFSPLAPRSGCEILIDDSGVHSRLP